MGSTRKGTKIEAKSIDITVLIGYNLDNNKGGER